MKNIKMGTYVRGDELYNFNFATDLSAYRKLMFVNYVVNTLVDEDRYDSIVKPLIFDFGIVTIMTDIDTSFINKRDDDNNIINPIIYIEQFIEETNVVDIVKMNMEIGLLEELENAVNLSIRYRTGIHPSPIADSIASILSVLEKKIDEFDMSNMMEMAQKLSGMTEDFTIDNLVNAYMNSDVHQKNLEEIAEGKKESAKKKNSKTKKDKTDKDEGNKVE